MENYLESVEGSTFNKREMSKDMLAGMALGAICIGGAATTAAHFAIKVVKRNKEEVKTIINDIINNL